MGRYSEQAGRHKRVVLEPAITRAFWSRERAWHGADVTLHIETRYVPDGTRLAIKIWEDDAGEGSPDDFIAEVKGTHVITHGRCEVPYTLKWDAKTLGRELALEGESLEFYFKVTIAKPALEKRSTLLYVDLPRFVVSG